LARTLTHEFQKNAARFDNTAQQAIEEFADSDNQQGTWLLRRLALELQLHASKLRLVHWALEGRLKVDEDGGLLHEFKRYWSKRRANSPFAVAAPVICFLGTAYAISRMIEQPDLLRRHDPQQLLTDPALSRSVLSRAGILAPRPDAR